MKSKLSITCLCLALVAVSPAIAEPVAKPDAPFFKGLGTLQHPITTSSTLAQRYFDQGLLLAYNFNHAEAIRSFKAAAAADPNCAMAWWGVAYCEGPNINLPMMPERYPRAWQALQRALALRAHASLREQAYIDALKVRYVETPPADRSPLDQAFVQAMRQVAVAHPDDLDAQTLFCEAAMTSMPWNYWTAERRPKPVIEEVQRILHTVLRRDPDHPGANHFFIHVVEAGPTPEQGLPAAERVEHFATAAGHLVHMASHIYVRVGEYDRAVLSNQRASRADEQYIAQCKAQGVYPGGYYPHNVHFLWYANSLRGNSREAIRAARKVAEYALDLRCGAIEGPRLRYLDLLARAQFGRWEEVLEQPAPADDFPFDQAMAHYARAIACIGLARLDAARAEQAAFLAKATPAAIARVKSDYFPAHQVIEVATAMLHGKLALAQGAETEALRGLRRAVELEDGIPYMEPPFWYYSARWSLGAAQIRLGHSAEAEATFRKDLEWLPRNGWALNGLAAALRNQGKTAAADSTYAQFKKAWQNADVVLDWTLY